MKLWKWVQNFQLILNLTKVKGRVLSTQGPPVKCDDVTGMTRQKVDPPFSHNLQKLEKIVEVHSVACSKQILAHGVPLVDRWTRSAVRNLDLRTINVPTLYYSKQESIIVLTNSKKMLFCLLTWVISLCQLWSRWYRKNIKQCIRSDHKLLIGS